MFGVDYNATRFVAVGNVGTIITSENAVAPVAPQLPDKPATQSRPFSCTINAFAGTGLTYTASNLPAGLSFDPTTHMISGTPTAIGFSTVTISATNASGTASASFALTVNPAPIISQRVFANDDNSISATRLLPLQNGEQILVGRKYPARTWLTRLNSENNTRWEMAFDNSFDLFDAAETVDGGVIAVGTFYSTNSVSVSVVTGNSLLTDQITSTYEAGTGKQIPSVTGTVFQTPPSVADWNNSTCLLAMKINPQGQIEWIRMIRGFGGEAICRTNGDNFWIIGRSSENNDGTIVGHHDPSCAPSCATTDVSVLKINSLGAVLQSRYYGSSSSESLNSSDHRSVKATADGGLVFAVHTTHTFSPPDGDFAGYTIPDEVVIKTRADASIEWIKLMPVSNFLEAVAVAQTTDGGYVIAGAASRSQSQYTDVKVTKVTTTGTTSWTRTYGGSYADQPTTIEATPDGGCILACLTQSNDGDVSGLHGTPGNSGDYWIIRLSTIGDLVYQRPFGSNGGELPGSEIGYIAVNTDNTFSLMGPVVANNGDILSPVFNSFGRSVWLVQFSIPATFPSNLTVVASANPATIQTTGTTALSATVSGGTPGYSYLFSGPGTIMPNSNTAIISGLSAGVQTFTITASDTSTPTSKTISTTVSVTVNQANTAPVATTNTNQTATVGTLFTYTVNTFADAETPTSLTYSAKGLPTGLSFNPVSRLISGTPGLSGVNSVTITATDPGSLSTSTDFTITTLLTSLTAVVIANPATILTTGTTALAMSVSGGTPGYSYLFSGPGTISPSGNTATVSGLSAGVQTFTVVASDATAPVNQTISSIVSVTVTQANTAPTIANIVPPQSATVGQAFSYVIPANTFTDAETSNALTLSVSGLPAGMNFTIPATISGTPSTSGVATIFVTATDPGNLSTNATFSITVNPALFGVTSLTLSPSASPATLLTTGTTTLAAMVSGGTSPYSYTFSGPGIITPSGNTATVSGLSAGVQTFTIIVSDATVPISQTSSATVSVTVTQTNTAPTITIANSTPTQICNAKGTPIVVNFTSTGTFVDPNFQIKLVKITRSGCSAPQETILQTISTDVLSATLTLPQVLAPGTAAGCNSIAYKLVITNGSTTSDDYSIIPVALPAVNTITVDGASSVTAPGQIIHLSTPVAAGISKTWYSHTETQYWQAGTLISGQTGDAVDVTPITSTYYSVIYTDNTTQCATRSNRVRIPFNLTISGTGTDADRTYTEGRGVLLDANSVVAGNGNHLPQYYIPSGADAGTQVYSTLYNTSYDRPWSAYFIIRKSNVWEIYSGFAGNFGPESYTRIYHTQDAFPTVNSGGRKASTGARAAAGTTGTRPPENADWIKDADNSTVALNLAGVSEQYTPPAASLTLVTSASPTSICVGGLTSLSVAVSGGTAPYSYSWVIPEGTLITGGTGQASSVTAVAVTSGPKTWTVTVADAAGALIKSATVSVAVGSLPNVIIVAQPGLIIPPGGSTTLVAAGEDNDPPGQSISQFVWSNGATTQFITLNTGGIYSVTGTSAYGCSTIASVTLTGSDLTPILILPQANFASEGSVGNFLVNIFEVNGLPTTLGNIAMTVTAPPGYTLAFDSGLTSINVSGGTENPVAINNAQWQVTSTLDNRQLSLMINPGQFIGAGIKAVLGFSITRTTANSGSLSNITVNINDDATNGYDGKRANNVYSRVINGL